MATKLTKKQRRFCTYMAQLRSPKEAACRAGYPRLVAEGMAMKLLEQAAVRQEIRKVEEQLAEQSARDEARACLRRIALTPPTDVVRLLLTEGEGLLDELEGMELFPIAEIKRAKGGGLEIKLQDRMRALELLLNLPGEEDQSQISQLYGALEQSAASLKEQPYA